MHSLEPFDCLNFDNHCVFDHEVESIATIQPLILVNDRQRALPIDVQSETQELERQTRFVRILEQPWPEFVVDLQRRSDDRFGESVQFFHALATCKDRDAV